ncbi:MAG: hypothetical protein ACPGU5_00075 [Lishizhenia sp.]
MRTFLICSLYLFVSSTTVLFAQLISDRPGISESSYSLKKSYFQLQIGLFSSSFNSNESNLITNRFRFGLGNDFEIMADVNYLFSRTTEAKTNQFSPLSIGVRKTIYSTKNTNLGVQLSSRIPLSKSISLFESSAYATRFAFLVDKSINQLNLACNLGILGSKMEEQYNLNSFYTLSVSTGKTWSPFIEIFGNTGELNNFSFNTISLNADAGIAYLINESFLVDLSAGILGVPNEQRGWILDFGFTWKAKTKKN